MFALLYLIIEARFSNDHAELQTTVAELLESQQQWKDELGEAQLKDELSEA